MNPEVGWDEVSFVTTSDYREDVLTELCGGPATPTGLAGSLDMHISHVSRSLQELRDRNYVELLVSEDRKKGRFYGPSEKGEAVAKRLDDLGGESDGG